MGPQEPEVVLPNELGGMDCAALRSSAYAKRRMSSARGVGEVSMFTADTLAGKVAVVTGAGTGIGIGIAEALTRAGAATVVSYNSSAAGAQGLVAQLTGEGLKAIAHPCDVSDYDAVQALFAAAVEAF